MSGKQKGLKVKVDIKGMDIFKDAVKLLKEIYLNKEVPQGVKDKIKNFIDSQKTK